MKFSLFLFLALSLNTTFASNEVLVGLATKDLTPSQDSLIPLGGYGGPERREWLNFFTKKPFWRMFKANQGSLDSIRSKVMFIHREETNQKLLFISLDVIGVTKEMHRDLMAKLKDLGFTPETVIISGTHTHSGPGALANNPVWEIMAMDRFQTKFYHEFLDNIIDSVKEAMNKKENSELFTLTFPTENLIKNRRGGDRPLYPDANVMLVKSMNGNWKGGIINFAVHGTAHGASNLKFSSDVPGAIEKSMQDLLNEKNTLLRVQDEAKFLFINGAEGDVAPRGNYIDLGKSFATQASKFWDEMKPLVPEWTVIQKEIDLGKPKIALSKCAEQKWIPKNINIGIKRWISSKTIIGQIHFQNLWFLTWPGEATTELGMKLREEARNNGAQDAWVLGLSNDHLAYFVTPEEFDKGGYEACTNFFGAQGGIKILEAHKNLSAEI